MNRQCSVINCVQPVAYSNTHHKYTQWCAPHLQLHRQECKVTNVRKKNQHINNELRYQNLLQSYKNLQFKHYALLQKYQQILQKSIT